MTRSILLVAALCLVTVSPAAASGVHTTVVSSRNLTIELDLTGTPGADDVTLTRERIDVTVTDPAGIQAGPGCTSLSAVTARCQADELTARLGDGDDRVTVSGGLAAKLDGGPGDDELHGDGAPDAFVGGPGNDLLDGGPGGSDSAAYDDRVVPVDVDMRRNVAAQLDGTDALTDIETVVGSRAADTMRSADTGGTTLVGGDGDDHLTGGPGADTLDGGRGDNTVTGAGGNDEIHGAGLLDGGLGDDRIVGRRGADDIVPGPGSDVVDPGGGNDRVDAVGGGVDTIDCASRFPLGPRLRIDLDAGDGTRACRGLHRRGAARPAIAPQQAGVEDYVGNVSLQLTCPQPLRNCPVDVVLRRTDGRVAARAHLILDREGLGIGFDVLLSASAERALDRVGRLHLDATLRGRDTRRRRVVDHARLFVTHTASLRSVTAPTSPAGR